MWRRAGRFKNELEIRKYDGLEMASTSIVILQETLARLTSDKRVRADDPLLLSLQQQIRDHETQQQQLQDDLEASFVPIFEILDDHPNGEECAKAYLTHKQKQRQQEATRTKEAELERLSLAKSKIAALLSRIRDNQTFGPYPRDFDAQKGDQLKRQLTQLLHTLNTQDGPVCADCGRIIQITVKPPSLEVHVEMHGYWTNSTDTDYSFTPSEYRRCHRC